MLRLFFWDIRSNGRHSVCKEDAVGIKNIMGTYADTDNERIANESLFAILFLEHIKICLFLSSKESVVSWLSLDRDNPKSNARFVKVFARPFLTDKEFTKGCKELDLLTSSFPAVMENLEQPQRRWMRR